MVLAAQTVEIDNLKHGRNSFFPGRPALVALGLYISGIIISVIVSANFLIPLSLSVILLIATIYFYAKAESKYAAWFAGALLVFLGWFNASLTSGPFPPNHIENLARTGGKAEIIGRVSEEPDIRADCAYLVVDVDSAIIKGYRIPSFGKVRLKINRGGSRYSHADFIKAAGFLYQPQGPRNPMGFDFGAWLSAKDIHACLSVAGPRDITILRKGQSFLGSVVSPTRNYLLAKTKEYLSPISAAMVSGFILGERRDIPDEYQAMFRNTGTLHLMAVSGSNVGLILVIFALPLTLLRVPRKPRIILLLAVIVFFAILTRLESSVVRASIMAALGLLAYGWLRGPDYINILGFAGLLMLLWNPQQLFDVGLQLSFAATFAIIYVIPDTLSVLSRFRPFNFRPLRWLMFALLTTVAAQLGVLPLLARYFNSFPVIGFAANVPIGLLASLSTMMGIGLYVLAIPGGFLPQMAAYPLEYVLNSIGQLLKFFSSIPGSVIKTYSPSWPAIILFWITLYMVFEILIRRRLSKKSMVVGLLAANLLIWSGLLQKKPFWEMDFVDVGRNRAWIFSEADGRTIAGIDLFDDEYEPSGVIINHILNFLDGRLDLIITSTDESSGIKTIKDQFSSQLISGDSLSSEIAGMRLTSKKPTNYIIPDSLAECAKVVWGESDNRIDGFFPSLLIEAEGKTFGFAADSKAEGLSDYLEDRPLTFLELPWGTYAERSCLESIEMLGPEMVVFSPDRSTVAMPGSRGELTHSKNRVFSTSICGAFSIIENADGIRIRTMRPVDDARE